MGAFDPAAGQQVRRDQHRDSRDHARGHQRRAVVFGRYGGESYERSSNALVSGSDRFSAKDVKPRGEPNPDGLLFGKRLVFTGTLASMSRAGAFQAAVDAGAKPLTSVSGRTDYLVLGVGAGYRKPDTPQSTKHPKALALAADGASVQIIDEDQFVCLLAGVATT